MVELSACFVCKEAASLETSGPSAKYNCPRCGEFTVVGTLIGAHPRFLNNTHRAVLSWKIRARQNHSAKFVLVESEQSQWGLEEPLPEPQQQFDLLLLWVSKRTTPGGSARLEIPQIFAVIGAPIDDQKQLANLDWLLRDTGADKYVKCSISSVIPFGDSYARHDVALTFAGWERVRELERATSQSFEAFMAMKFGDEEMSRMFNGPFKRAAKRAGFTLRTLDEGQPAGPIDAQLRVRLRRSAFVIADLTHGNQGAYWEAGFAEGLGKPVVYSCRKDVWDSKECKPHFDTNHMYTLIWTSGKEVEIENSLTNTIRDTFPDIANMID
jgi:nucleoside 2-deoxyribosyltransferase